MNGVSGNNESRRDPIGMTWWECLPREVRVGCIITLLLLCSLLVFLLNIGASHIHRSVEEFRMGADTSRPEMEYWSDDLGPRRERGKEGIVCSIFGSLLRRPQRCN